MEILYTIQMASKLSGVGVHTIRAWEKRYTAIKPGRDTSGHRAYSKTDVEKLILLSEACLLGYSISKIASYSIAELKELLKTLGKTEIAKNEVELTLYETKSPEVDINQSINIILFALREYKLDIIIQEINKLKILLSEKEFALKIILPIMSELGGAVARGDYNVSQEHALSAILKFHIGQLFFRSIDQHRNNKYNVILCGIEEDHHEFGIIIGSLLAIHHNLNLIYLGPNLPANSLIDSIKFLKPEVVVVGATRFIDQLGTAFKVNYVTKVLKGTPAEIKLVLGSSEQIEITQEYKKRFMQLKNFEDLDEFFSKLKK